MTYFRLIVQRMIALLSVSILIYVVYSEIGLIGTLLFMSVSMFAASAIDINAGADSSIYPY